jgi:hypothetical protein
MIKLNSNFIAIRMTSEHPLINIPPIEEIEYYKATDYRNVYMVKKDPNWKLVR